VHAEDKMEKQTTLQPIILANSKVTKKLVKLNVNLTQNVLLSTGMHQTRLQMFRVIVMGSRDRLMAMFKKEMVGLLSNAS